MNEDKLIKALMESLGAYLLSNMSSITSQDQIVYQFPEASREMEEFPMISIITQGAPEYQQYMGLNNPYSSVENDPGKTYDYKFTVGQYDIPLQIDLWTDYKERRHTLLQEFLTAFNEKLLDQGHGGVNLTLSDYHDAKVNFLITGINYDDSEESSQRHEWRVKIDVIVNCEAIFEATNAAMVDNQAVTTIDDSSTIDE